MVKKWIKTWLVLCVVIFMFGMFTACDGVKYKVAFSTNGGSYVETIEVAEGGVIETEPVSTKDGYVLVGWYPSEKATEKVTFPYEVNANTMLYAKWEVAGAYDGYITFSMCVGAYPYGGSVEKAYLTFDREVTGSSFNASTFVVSHSGGNMETTAAYLSDESGEKITDAQSKYVTLEFNTRATAAYMLDIDTTTLTVNLSDNSKLIVGGKEYTALAWTRVSFDDYSIPVLDEWTLGVPHTVGDRTLYCSSYTPESLAGGEKNPLIVWLHGGSEGGSDPYVALLSYEVTAISTTLQSYFVSGDQVGAYVLVPQCATGWSRNPDGTTLLNCRSDYTDVMWSAIKEYVANNPDVDTNRIYIGGCSAGGYMVLNMMFDDTENYFAAAFPICQAWIYESITEEWKDALAERPVWFTQAADDLTSLPIATHQLYIDLISRGATNVFYSYFENVTYDGRSYSGHSSWILALADQCKYIQPTGIGTTVDDLDPTLQTVHPDYPTMWAWLAAQSN